MTKRGIGLMMFLTGAPLALALGPSASAEGRPGLLAGDALPNRTASALIVERDEPLYSSPEPKARRRGSAQIGANLPIYSATRGPGCRGHWLMVGPLAWVCEDRVRLSSRPALEAQSQPQALGDGLPYRYHFVGPNGALGYKELGLAEQVEPDLELQPGFAIAVVEVARHNGDAFGLTPKSLWIPMRELGPAHPLPFRGAELDDGKLELGWVYESSAPVYKSPGGARVPDEAHPQWERFDVLETVTRGGHRWFRIGEQRWLSDREVRAPSPAAIPREVRPGERWIDVDIANQVLIAYEGEHPVFATLVSTGKGKGKSIQATPVGVHHVWVKLKTSDMDNLEDEDAARYYAIQDVPWVMYFTQGYGLHGTFWHRGFGRVRSHGCVNLTPLDAERLFYWTSPSLPAGWNAVLPSEYDEGTLIRIR